MRRVVITGLGVVSPIGNNVNEFWNNLINGKSGIDFIKSFKADEYPVKIAAEVKNFNAENFGIDKMTLRHADIYTLYAIAAAKEAIADSKLEIEPESTGVYVGTGMGGVNSFFCENKRLVEEGPKWISPYLVTQIIPNIAASNISILFNTHGPCISLSAACATGGESIGEAYRAIKDNYTDTIIAGSSEAPISQIAIAGFANCKTLTKSEDPNNASLPFDKRRNGFVLGEGAGILILEEYEHAKNRHAKIYAEICGYGCTSDAYHVTSPSPDGIYAAKAIQQAVQQAHISDKDSIHINAHGTGTVLNDRAETLAIKIALGDKMAYKAHISSNKSMIGHLLGASGSVEMIASTLSICNNIVPPTIHLEEPDPECDLDYTPNVAEKVDLSLVISNSFGFGGHNTCIAIRKI